MYIDSVGSTSLRDSIAALRKGPYKSIAAQGGDLSGDDADLAQKHLENFAAALSSLATRLVERESAIQSDRVRDTLIRCQNQITLRLSERATVLLKSTGNTFQGLRHVFDCHVALPPLRLPKLRFESRYERWERQWIDWNSVQRTRQERRWYTLWLIQHDVVETEKVPIQRTDRGYRFNAFKDLLRGFIEQADTGPLEKDFLGWLQQGLEAFDSALSASLERGVEDYRRFLYQRGEELQRGAEQRIANVEQHRQALDRFHTLIERSRDWRRVV